MSGIGVHGCKDEAFTMLRIRSNQGFFTITTTNIIKIYSALISHGWKGREHYGNTSNTQSQSYAQKTDRHTHTHTHTHLKVKGVDGRDGFHSQE